MPWLEIPEDASSEDVHAGKYSEPEYWTVTDEDGVELYTDHDVEPEEFGRPGILISITDPRKKGHGHFASAVFTVEEAEQIIKNLQTEIEVYKVEGTLPPGWKAAHNNIEQKAV